MRNETLRDKYLISSATSRGGGDKFEYLCKLVQIVIKDQEEEEARIRFMFQIFSDFQPRMKRPALKDFCDIFRIPSHEFGEN